MENFERYGNTRPPDLPPEKSVCRLRRNRKKKKKRKKREKKKREREREKKKRRKTELDIEQWSGSKLAKEYINAVYCHPAYLPYIQSTSCKMLSRMKHKLESRLQ